MVSEAKVFWWNKRRLQPTDQPPTRRRNPPPLMAKRQDQLQTLQHLQACKDRELVYLRVVWILRSVGNWDPYFGPGKPGFYWKTPNMFKGFVF